MQRAWLFYHADLHKFVNSPKPGETGNTRWNMQKHCGKQWAMVRKLGKLNMEAITVIITQNSLVLTVLRVFNLPPKYKNLDILSFNTSKIID